VGFNVGKEDFDFLSLITADVFVLVTGGNMSSDITCRLMDTSSDLSKTGVGAALLF
jgi:hypothetical protein